MSAVFPMVDDDVDAGVPWHHGDPLGEQRLLAAGRGMVDLSHRGTFELTGDDRLALLDALTSQAVRTLAPGDSAHDLLLDPHGRIDAELHVVALPDRLLVTTEPGHAARVAAFLDSRKFMMRVDVRDVSADWASVWEPVRAPHPEFPTVLTPEAFSGLPMPEVGSDISRYRSALESIFAGREVLVPRERLEAHLAATGERVGTWAWNALRIAAGVPRHGVETDDKSIPHELGWLGAAVHMRKGCYTGQETVARTHNMGKPPRRLVILHLDGSRDHLPAHGADVLLDGRRVGFLGMAVHHHELGPIASAVVKRNTDPAAILEVDGLQASQEVVVNP